MDRNTLYNQRQQENKCLVHYDTRSVDLSHVSAGRVVILQIMAIREKEVCKMLNISVNKKINVRTEPFYFNMAEKMFRAHNP